MENYRQLLAEAFEAQRRDRNIDTPPEHRIAGIEYANGSRFVYVGQLPHGIKEFARDEASAVPKDPYLVFDEPLDMGVMEHATSEVLVEEI